MEQLVKGVLTFRTEVFDKKKAFFARLPENQTPRALFITCSDSGANPTLPTQTDPGELFILRNAGYWVYDCTSEQFTSLLYDAVPRLKVAR